MNDWKHELATMLATWRIEDRSATPCALVDFDLLDLDGGGARQLLHGQVTCEVRDLQPGQMRFGALCSPAGRIQATLYLLDRGDGFLVCLPPGQGAPIATLLGKVAPFFRVAINDASDRFCPVVCRELPTPFDGIAAPLDDDYSLAWLRPEDAPVFVGSRTTGTAGESATAPQPDWQHLWIERGWPAIVPATRDRFLPQDLNLDLGEAVSFSKGCYTGQEIIARLHYRGKAKRRLQRVWLEGSASVEAGDILRDAEGRAVAEVLLDPAHDIGQCGLLAVAPVDLAPTGELEFDSCRLRYTAEPLTPTQPEK